MVIYVDQSSLTSICKQKSGIVHRNHTRAWPWSVLLGFEEFNERLAYICAAPESARHLDLNFACTTADSPERSDTRTTQRELHQFSENWNGEKNGKEMNFL